MPFHHYYDVLIEFLRKTPSQNLIACKFLLKQNVSIKMKKKYVENGRCKIAQDHRENQCVL